MDCPARSPGKRLRSKIVNSFLAKLWALVLSLFGSLACAGALGAIGVETGSLANPFFQAVVRGIITTAKAMDPKVEIVTLQNEYDLLKEQLNIRHLRARKVKLIFISAADSKLVAPLVTHARNAGIVVVAVDVLAPGADATVMTDNIAAGDMACDHLARALHGRGKVAIQTGPRVSSVLDRVAGCQQALARYPDLVLIPGRFDGNASPVGGRAAMKHILKAAPGVNGVFTINDRQALGSAKALDSAGRRDVLIASVDGSPDIVRAMKTYRNIRASVVQDPYLMGKRAVEVGAELLAGQAAPGAPIKLKPSLLTQENLADFRGWQTGSDGAPH